MVAGRASGTFCIGGRIAIEFIRTYGAVRRSSLGGGFDQCFNAQAGVDTETMLVLGIHVSQIRRRLRPAIRWNGWSTD